MIRMNKSRILRWTIGATGGTVLAVNTLKHEPEPPPPPPTKDGNLTKDAAEAVGVGTAAGVAGAKIATYALCGIGFTEAGVAAKSLAAAWQASIGNVAAGSTFSGLQAVAAKGGVAFFGPVGISVAVVGGGLFVMYKVRQNRLKEEQELLRLEEERKNKQLYNKLVNAASAWNPWK